jgi:hypothetical protein
MEGKEHSTNDVHSTGSEDDKNKSFYSRGLSNLIRIRASKVKLFERNTKQKIKFMEVII